MTTDGYNTIKIPETIGRIIDEYNKKTGYHRNRSEFVLALIKRELNIF